MQAFSGHESPIGRNRNKILLFLIFMVGTSFLTLSYYTDTLGKFSQFLSLKSDKSIVTASVKMDSYGNFCSPNSNYGDQYVLIVRKDSGCKLGASSGDREAL